MYGRFASAFDWRSDEAVAAVAASRIDAWIDPPPYAGRPPLVIDFKTADPQTLTVPEDSVLVVRGDPSVVGTRVEGGIAPSEQKSETPASRRARTAAAKRAAERADRKAVDDPRARQGDDLARRRDPRRPPSSPSRPAGNPTIVSTEEPRANLSGSLTLAYRTQDRFGLASARADFARPHEGPGPAPRTLAPPPQAALQLPPTANGVGDARTTVDLSEHPWAGAKVTMRLSAVSISGKTGESAPIEVTLPQRIFHNPLARALVEQRRDLILDPDHAPKRVDTALTGLTIAPELFDTPANIYLGLKQAKTSLDARPQRRRSARRRRPALGDGAADRGRRRLASRARPARRRAGAARSASARRERRGNQEADAAIARGRQPLHERDGAQLAARQQSPRTRTFRRRISTS